MSQRSTVFSDVYPNYDAWSQLRSIHELIYEVFAWRNRLHGAISEAEHDQQNSAVGMEEMVAEATTNDMYLRSVYRDSAAVQAAVGALVPFLEGFFVHAFDYLGQLHGNTGALTEHKRWRMSTNNFWNPRQPEGIANGLRELRDAIGLRDWLSDSALDQIELAFVFRNRSLHFAYEWPREKVEAFGKFLEEHSWGDHVEWASSDNMRWMAYLKDEFLSGLLETATDIVGGFVEVASDRGGVFRADPAALPGFGPGETP